MSFNLHDWNKKLYSDKKLWQAEEFWNELGLKSWPKFKDCCTYHIPLSWAEEVKKLVLTVQKNFGDQVRFRQIKEKFCYLTIYYDADSNQIHNDVRKLINKSIDNLVKQGLHPERNNSYD
jgi:hypothetical protein